MEPTERARKNLTTALNCISDAKGSEISKDCGISEGQISKLKNGPLADICTILAHCGLKIVPTGRVCVRTEEYKFMTGMVARALASESTSRLLLLHEDEDDE